MTKPRKKNDKLILLLAILVAAFWILGSQINVYQVKIVGAIFEILWFPMLILFILLPLASIFYMVQNKFKFNNLYWLALIILLATFLYLNSGYLFNNE